MRKADRNQLACLEHEKLVSCHNRPTQHNYFFRKPKYNLTSARKPDMSKTSQELSASDHVAHQECLLGLVCAKGPATLLTVQLSDDAESSEDAAEDRQQSTGHSDEESTSFMPDGGKKILAMLYAYGPDRQFTHRPGDDDEADGGHEGTGSSHDESSPSVLPSRIHRGSRILAMAYAYGPGGELTQRPTDVASQDDETTDGPAQKLQIGADVIMMKDPAHGTKSNHLVRVVEPNIGELDVLVRWKDSPGEPFWTKRRFLRDVRDVHRAQRDSPNRRRGARTLSAASLEESSHGS